MPYIEINNNLPGIGGLLREFPHTGDSLSKFTQDLLRGESSLTPGERELIATYTSYINNCYY